MDSTATPEADIKSRETVAVEHSLSAVEGLVERERMAVGGRFVHIYLVLECHREQARARELAVERGYGDSPGGSSGGASDGSAARPAHARVSTKDLVREELVATLDLPSRRVGDMIDLAVVLHERAPAVLDAMLAGLIDETRARRICQRLQGVSDDETCSEIAREVMDQYAREREEGRLFSTEAVRTMVDEAVAEHDPAGVQKRRVAARRDRRVRFYPGTDGMCDMRASLPSEHAAIIVERLERLARDGVQAMDSVPPTIDTRTFDNRRADALVALAGGFLAGSAAPADYAAPADSADSSDSAAPADSATDPSAAPTAGRPLLRPLIMVIAGESGASEVTVRGLGTTSVEALIEMLRQSDGATLIKTGTGLTPTTPAQADTYRIPDDLARRVRARDGTCRFPGCSMPSRRCDVDHVRPFAWRRGESGGKTVESNLVCLCRHHHRLKTFEDFSLSLAEDGTLTVHTPNGQVVTTKPSGPLARARLRSGSPPPVATSSGIEGKVDETRAAVRRMWATMYSIEKDIAIKKAERARRRAAEERD